LFDFARVEERGGWFDVFVGLVGYLVSGESRVGFLNRGHPVNLIDKGGPGGGDGTIEGEGEGEMAGDVEDAEGKRQDCMVSFDGADFSFGGGESRYQVANSSRFRECRKENKTSENGELKFR
jgi:hypothetical protein